MIDYLITAEFATELQSAIGTAIGDASESGLIEYSDKLRVLLAQLTARPVAEPVHATLPSQPLSDGWQVTVEYEMPDGSFPYVTDRNLVVGAVAELLDADLADSSVTIEDIDGRVEEVDSVLGEYLIPLTQSHVEQLAIGTSEFLVNHPMDGLIYIRVSLI